MLTLGYTNSLQRFESFDNSRTSGSEHAAQNRDNSTKISTRTDVLLQQAQTDKSRLKFSLKLILNDVLETALRSATRQSSFPIFNKMINQSNAKTETNKQSLDGCALIHYDALHPFIYK